MSKGVDRHDGLARRNLGRRASVVLRTLCLTLLGLTAGPPAVADQFFMQKKAVEKAPSTRFETITIYETDSAGNPRALVLPSRAPLLVVPPQVGRLAVEPYLEQYGVVLVRMAPAVSRAELDPVVERYNRSVAGRLRAFSGREADGNRRGIPPVEASRDHHGARKTGHGFLPRAIPRKVGPGHP
jgi:hypothetical protein